MTQRLFATRVEVLAPSPLFRMHYRLPDGRIEYAPMFGDHGMLPPGATLLWIELATDETPFTRLEIVR